MTFTEQVKAVAEILKGKHVFTCPNYAVIAGQWNGKPIEVSVHGPAVRDWQKKNEKIITEMKAGKLV